METFLIIFGIINLVVSILSMVNSILAIDEGDFLYLFIDGILLWPISVYIYFRDNYNRVGSALLMILSIIIYPGIIIGSIFPFIFYCIKNFFNFLFKRKDI